MDGINGLDWGKRQTEGRTSACVLCSALLIVPIAAHIQRTKRLLHKDAAARGALGAHDDVWILWRWWSGCEFWLGPMDRAAGRALRTGFDTVVGLPEGRAGAAGMKARAGAASAMRARDEATRMVWKGFWLCVWWLWGGWSVSPRGGVLKTHVVGSG